MRILRIIAAATRKIVIPAEDYDDLMLLIEKTIKGGKDWTDRELQLQQNYPEAVEVLLRQKNELV